MKIYRVGGAVRDLLRGYPSKDQDFVVVGATVEEFQKSYPQARQIGKSFPVFQYVGEAGQAQEFAFARRERKTGTGHKNFEVVSDPSVTLEEDLSRRDLTVNAMAMPLEITSAALEAQVIDPFGGVDDLGRRVLRHIGPAFAEDPLRIFRLARFAATLGFSVHPDTYVIARTIPLTEILALSAERVCEEFRKAMRSLRPRWFVEVLRNCGALASWFPELSALTGIPAGPPDHHGEGDALQHTLLCLDAVESSLYDLSTRELIHVSVLFHDLGKGLTPRAEWPSHHDHDVKGVPIVESCCTRLRLPIELSAAAVISCREHMKVHRFMEMRKGKMVDLIKVADRTKLKSEGLAAVCQADALGRIPSTPSPGATALVIAAEAARTETGHPIPESLSGEHIGLHVRNQKGNAVRRALREKVNEQ